MKIIDKKATRLRTSFLISVANHLLMLILLTVILKDVINLQINIKNGLAYDSNMLAARLFHSAAIALISLTAGLFALIV